MDGDRPLLIETALVGPPLSRPTLRANPLRCVDEVVSWLMRLPGMRAGVTGPFERLISQPLAVFAELFPDEAPEELVARTLEIVGLSATSLCRTSSNTATSVTRI